MTLASHSKPAYKVQALVYLNQAHSEFAKGDLRQASEKGWGAASQIVKAIAEKRGLPHTIHADLFKVVSSLNNPQLRQQFGVASQLHVNFYEGMLDKPTVRQYLGSVDALVYGLSLLL